MSTLCGSFWEPEVPCNLVSPWLHPVPEEVLGGTSVMNDGDQELFTLIGVIRRPNMRTFWVGAVTSGLVPNIVQKVRGGRPPIDSFAFAWTGCPQSFMDVAGSGSYISDLENVSRLDIWR